MAGRHLLAICAMAVLALSASIHPARSADGQNRIVDFSGFPGGSVLGWLRGKGFEPQQDASNSRRVVLSASPSQLELETRTRAFGLLLKEMDVPNVSRVHIDWGVDTFPAGASYERGNRSEAIMVYFFFGQERHPSGSMFVPNSPHFLALFLCESDPIDTPFKGRFHHNSGRFICVARPKPGAAVATDFPLAETFKRVFGKSEVPDISGIGVAIDTSNVRGNNGVAKSFIRKIEFPE